MTAPGSSNVHHLSAVAPLSSAADRILREAGPTVSVPETARVLNVSRDLVYAMVKRGELAAMGIRVLRLGARIRIGTASLRRAVDVDPDARSGGGAVT